jgi:L-alanine-DL-glutamate epimerase-like enolase superfamily enzyme
MDVVITGIDTIALRIPLNIWAPPPMSHGGLPRTHVESLYVRVTTNCGITGWGESFGTARPMVIAAFEHYIRRLTVGQSATDRSLVPRVERVFLSLGRGGPAAAALAGLDIALWDIWGKLEGVPISTLLGGAKRQRLECYASLMQYYGNPEYLKQNTSRALEHGYRWIKLHERTAEAVAIARETIGPEIPLMVDTNCAWTLEEAEPAIMAMKGSNPYWVEEPVYPPEDFEGLADLRKKTGVALGMGENATSWHDFRTMVATGAADFVQPSIVKMGGISALSRMAAEVEKMGATCVPNGFYLGPGFLALLHCMAVKEKASPVERIFAEFGATPYARTVPIEHGSVQVPEGPGLGADPDEDLLEQFRI